MGLFFANGKAVHHELLSFTTLSATPVMYNGGTYYIQHSQFASYDLQDVFTSAVTGVDGHPRDEELEFGDQLRDAVEDTVPVNRYRNHRHQFSAREQLDPSKLYQAGHDLYMEKYIDADATETKALGNELQPGIPGAVADSLSLMLAMEASETAMLDIGEFYADNDDTNAVDEGLDYDLIKFALRDTVMQLHGPAALQQPDPSLHLCNALWEIYDEIGMNPTIRHVYGVIVDPLQPRFYQPDDAHDRRISHSLGSLMSSVMKGGQDHDARWINPNEPPIESLESYQNQQGSNDD